MVQKIKFAYTTGFQQDFNKAFLNPLDFITGCFIMSLIIEYDILYVYKEWSQWSLQMSMED